MFPDKIGKEFLEIDYPDDVDRIALFENHIKILLARVNYLHDRLNEAEKQINLQNKI